MLRNIYIIAMNMMRTVMGIRRKNHSSKNCLINRLSGDDKPGGMGISNAPVVLINFDKSEKAEHAVQIIGVSC